MWDMFGLLTKNGGEIQVSGLFRMRLTGTEKGDILCGINSRVRLKPS